MKVSAITLILITIIFGAGFISFENKKGEYGKELHELRSEFNNINENQVRILELKRKRADYFKKVFIINRPETINSSISGLLNLLIRLDNRKIRFAKINITSRTGAFEFEITGFFRRVRNLEDLSDKLESSAGAFIHSRIITEKNRNQFVITGEVSVE